MSDNPSVPHDARPNLGGEKMRRYRRKLAQTQAEFGKRYGVTTNAISRYERGESRIRDGDRRPFEGFICQYDRSRTDRRQRQGRYLRDRDGWFGAALPQRQQSDLVLFIFIAL